MNKIRILLTVIMPVIIVVTFNSCTGCSKSGRLKIIAQNMAKREEVTPEPSSTISKDEEKSIIEIDNINNDLTPPTPIDGNLIQTGGVVAQLASNLAIDLNVSISNVSQIIAMQKYVNSKWHYIHDPNRDTDTWRSAEATIRLRHKGKFPGDCDDFAILMASLAKQIGLKSRMAAGYYNSGGHAWAEFRLEQEEANNQDLRGLDYRTDAQGTWISLDWFKGRDHTRYTNDVRIYDDL